MRTALSRRGSTAHGPHHVSRVRNGGWLPPHAGAAHLEGLPAEATGHCLATVAQWPLLGAPAMAHVQGPWRLGFRRTAREQTRGRSQGARAVRFVPLATPESVSWPRSRDLWKRSTAEARRRWRRKTTSSNRFAILNFLAIHTRKLIVWRWRFLPIIPSSCPLEKEAFWREQSAKYLAT